MQFNIYNSKTFDSMFTNSFLTFCNISVRTHLFSLSVHIMSEVTSRTLWLNLKRKIERNNPYK